MINLTLNDTDTDRSQVSMFSSAELKWHLITPSSFLWSVAKCTSWYFWYIMAEARLILSPLYTEARRILSPLYTEEHNEGHIHIHDSFSHVCHIQQSTVYWRHSINPQIDITVVTVFVTCRGREEDAAQFKPRRFWFLSVSCSFSCSISISDLDRILDCRWLMQLLIVAVEALHFQSFQLLSFLLDSRVKVQFSV